MGMVNVEDVKVGAWVKAPSFLETDMDPAQTRSLRVLRLVEHKGRPASRDGDAPVPMSERMVWRYVDQVTSIVRPART